MFGPGAYRSDPPEGMTAIADLPAPEIVPYSRTYERQAVLVVRTRFPGMSSPSGSCVTSGIAMYGVPRDLVVTYAQPS
jgi:hypothetical protein